jgi:hydroxypyruvate isomerase
MKFSANLGFLWADSALPKAIHAAKTAGFDAVELHWPYAFPASEVLSALQETGLPVLGLNTTRGDVDAGDNGLAAVPGREAEARAYIDEAVAYGAEIGAGNVHVMAGFATGPEAKAAYLTNLRYASEATAKHGMNVLIEPLNRHDVPGYFLGDTGQAAAIISEIGAPNIKLMFDCYHVGRTEGDVVTKLSQLIDIVGHIQFASVPDRGPPDHGELNYTFIFDAIRRLGWETPLGAEYKPKGPTDATLDWLNKARKI